MKKRYSVDEKSYDLAKYFLGDDRPEETYKDLAQAIQDCVEDFCREVDRETPPHIERAIASEGGQGG